MDIFGPDAAKSPEQRKHQRGGDKEYRAKRQKISDEAHENYASCRGEALIASKSFAECYVANDTKADGNNRQPQEPAGGPLEHQSCQHQWKTRPNCNNQRASCDHTGT
jgi:hypothetical protein